MAAILLQFEETDEKGTGMQPKRHIRLLGSMLLVGLAGLLPPAAQARDATGKHRRYRLIAVAPRAVLISDVERHNLVRWFLPVTSKAAGIFSIMSRNQLPGPVTPRNFEANVLSISLRYVM
jgi:hypothetical protein